MSQGFRHSVHPLKLDSRSPGCCVFVNRRGGACAGPETPGRAPLTRSPCKKDLNIPYKPEVSFSCLQSQLLSPSLWRGCSQFGNALLKIHVYAFKEKVKITCGCVNNIPHRSIFLPHSQATRWYPPKQQQQNTHLWSLSQGSSEIHRPTAFHSLHSFSPIASNLRHLWLLATPRKEKSCQLNWHNVLSQKIFVLYLWKQCL